MFAAQLRYIIRGKNLIRAPFIMTMMAGWPGGVRSNQVTNPILFKYHEKDPTGSTHELSHNWKVKTWPEYSGDRSKALESEIVAT